MKIENGKRFRTLAGPVPYLTPAKDVPDGLVEMSFVGRDGLHSVVYLKDVEFRLAESVNLETVGGEGIDQAAGTSDEDSAPIKVVLRPIYELIRPDKFPGADPALVIAKREQFEKAHQRMMNENGLSPARISQYELASGLNQPIQQTDVILKRGRKFSKMKSQETGTPVLFTFVASGFTPLPGEKTIKVTDNQNRSAVVMPFPGLENVWICYMTVVPRIKNGQYDYQEYATVTVKGWNATQTFRLGDIRLGKEPYGGKNGAKAWEGMRTPRFARTAYLRGDAKTYIIGYAERAFQSTVSDQNAVGLPLAPWE